MVYTSYAAPTKKVTDYRTHVSGILPRHIADAPPFATVRRCMLTLEFTQLTPRLFSTLETKT